jgi:Cation transporter/ATPase, N-terminus
MSPEEAPWHARSEAEVVAALDAGPDGLTSAEAQARLTRHGPNRLPEARGRSAARPAAGPAGRASDGGAPGRGRHRAGARRHDPAPARPRRGAPRPPAARAHARGLRDPDRSRARAVLAGAPRGPLDCARADHCSDRGGVPAGPVPARLPVAHASQPRARTLEQPVRLRRHRPSAGPPGAVRLRPRHADGVRLDGAGRARAGLGGARFRGHPARHAGRGAWRVARARR